MEGIEYVNVFAPDGAWLGMFMDADTARNWLSRTNKDTSTHEVVAVGEREGRAVKLAT